MQPQKHTRVYLRAHEDDGVLNDTVSHTCKVRRAGCNRTEQAAWINESVKALMLVVVDEANPIRAEVVFDIGTSLCVFDRGTSLCTSKQGKNRRILPPPFGAMQMCTQRSC